MYFMILRVKRNFVYFVYLTFFSVYIYVLLYSQFKCVILKIIYFFLKLLKRNLKMYLQNDYSTKLEWYYTRLIYFCDKLMLNMIFLIFYYKMKMF